MIVKKNISLILRIVVATILIQTLRFKFFAHPDSVFIFKTIGLEPIGRIGIGVLELIAGVFLLIPKTVWVGATLTLAVIGGAILMHLTKLGIVTNNDQGLLFITAIITFILAAIILYLNKKSIPFYRPS